MRSDSYAKEASYGGMNDRDLADRAYVGYGAPARKQGMFAGRKKIWWGLGFLALVRFLARFHVVDPDLDSAQLAIIGGVVAGILISRNNNDKSSNSSSSSQQNGGSGTSNSGSTSNGGSSAGTGTSTGSAVKPSQKPTTGTGDASFTLDPRLKKCASAVFFSSRRRLTERSLLLFGLHHAELVWPGDALRRSRIDSLTAQTTRLAVTESKVGGLSCIVTYR